ICLLDTGTDTPLRYESEEKIKKRIWKMVNDITKFQKVNPEFIKTMVNFFKKNYEEMVKGEHEAIPFAKIQDNIKPHVIIGYNSNGFDMPFIIRRLKWLGSTMIEEFYRIATITDVIDEIVLLAIETAKIQNEITKLNVDSMNYHNKIEELNSRQGKVINDLHGEEGVEKLCTDILEYCFYDSWAVLLSIIKMQKLVSYRLDEIIYNCEYAQPLRSDKTSMLNCLIAKEYNKEHNDKPVSYGIKDKKKFQGAEVIDPETRYYMDPIYVLDFASLYLSIMREYNMGPNTLRYEKPNEKHQVVHLVDNNVGTNQDIYFIHEDTQESIIRNILTDLIKKRKEAKKERDNIGNALYEGLGSPYLGIAIPVISQYVTFVARELIKTLKKFIESYHTREYRNDHNVICDETSEVIYRDTDSCLARLPKPILRCILEKYYGHLKYIELNNSLVKEYEELIFKIYDELTKEESIFGKK
ncbi:21387_t:CDS:2, partial [Racocetra persica]